MLKQQYQHASRMLRTNGWDFTEKFLRNYPERVQALRILDSQRRDKLADRAYIKSLNHPD